MLRAKGHCPNIPHWGLAHPDRGWSDRGSFGQPPVPVGVGIVSRADGFEAQASSCRPDEGELRDANRVAKSSFNIRAGVGVMLCSAHKDSREIRSSVDGFTPPTQLSSDASYWEK